MKKIIFSLLFGFGFCLGLTASHIESCDLTYRYMGNNNYEIQLSFYRDCSGVAEPTNVSVNCKSTCGNNFNITLNKLAPTQGEELTPVCPGTVTTCGGGTLFGFKRFIYSGLATLPPCASWTLSYSLCCRNPSNTIQSPTSASMYIPAFLNNLSNTMNSSPYFSDIPTAVICNGQQNCIYFGCEDMDGDSLVYSMITPWNTGPGTGTPNVIYLTTPVVYTAQQPLQSTPPVTINHATGEVCMTPTANLTTVFAVQVDEYRRVAGAPAYKIGSIIRDIQMTVISCTNTVPKLAGINPAATQYNSSDITYSDTACVGSTLSFNVYPYDPDIDILTMTYSNILYGPTWSVTNNQTTNPVGHFQWTPIPYDTVSNPHCFFIKIADNNCPYLGYRNFCYCLTVVPTHFQVVFNLPTDSVCSTAGTVLLTGESPGGGVFSGNGVFSNSFIPSAGIYGYNPIVYTYTLGGCSYIAKDSIWVDNCTGISKPGNEDENIRIYPNPVSSSVNIDIRNVYGMTQLFLKDIVGRDIVYETKNIHGHELFSFDINDLKAGIYILTVSTDSKTITRKIVKSR